jgi:hypothetical protein
VPTEQRLGIYLWHSSIAEAIGTGVFARLGRWDYLDPSDRLLARQYAQEEAHHAELLRGLAKRVMPAPPGTYRWSQPADLWVAFTEVAQSERMSLPAFRRMIALGEALGEPDLVDAYQTILAEEHQHVQWGQRILRGLRATPRFATEMRAYCAQHRLAREYRNRKGDLPWA